jgi:hypothetical protein
MRSLSSLLVQREAAPMRAVEEAISRQVLHGGDLPTNLLEVSEVAEEKLLGVVAEAFELAPVPAGPLEVPAAEALRIQPGELALRHGIFPLELRDEGRVLVVATAEPLAAGVEDDLAFALDVGVLQRAALLVRVRQAIAVSYGIPLDRRLLRVVARLEGRPDPSPSEYPPAMATRAGGVAAVAGATARAVEAALRGPGDHARMQMPRPLSVPAPTFGTGLPNSVRAPPPDDPATRGPSGTPRTPVVTGGAPMPVIPKAAPLPLALDPLTPSPAPASAASSRARGAERTRALAGIVRKEVRKSSAEIAKVGRESRAPRRKGPFTHAMAEAELEAAHGADEVFDTFLAFASQFLGYTALFVVHGDLAEGRSASGPGASAAKVASIGVPLDLPSAFASARDRRGPHVARLAAQGLDAEIARDLDRTHRKTALVLPLLVRGRAVGLLYGDDGEEDVALAGVGDVIAMSALAGAALERMAMRKKHGARAELTPIPKLVARKSNPRAASLSLAGVTPPPARAGGVEALARALDLTPAPDDRAVSTTNARGIAATKARPVDAAANAGAAALTLEPSSDPPPATEAATRDPPPQPQVSPGAESVRGPDLIPHHTTDVSPGAARPPSADEALSSLPGGPSFADVASDAAQRPVARAPSGLRTAATAELRRDKAGKPVIVDEDSGETISKAVFKYSSNDAQDAADDALSRNGPVDAPISDLPSPRPVAGTPAGLATRAPHSGPPPLPPTSVVASTVREGRPKRNTQPGLGIPVVGSVPPPEVAPEDGGPVPWPGRRSRAPEADDPSVGAGRIVDIGDAPARRVRVTPSEPASERARTPPPLPLTPSAPPARPPPLPVGAPLGRGSRPGVDRERPTAVERKGSEEPDVDALVALPPRALKQGQPGTATPALEPRPIVGGAPVAPRALAPPDLIVTDPPSSPEAPVIGVARRRSPSEKPLPREELDDSPGTRALVEAMDRGDSGARSPQPRRAAEHVPTARGVAPSGPAPRYDVPPRSRPPSAPPPPSVIVDVAAEYGALLQRTLEGGPKSQEAFAELVRQGEHALQVLMVRFPGPLRVDRHRARAELPAASQCGPLLELIVAVRRGALPFVTVRTSSPEVEVRFWATHVLGELRYPEAANALVPRLFDDDVAVRRVARRSAAALVGAGEAGAPILQGLDHMVRSPDQPVPYRVLAIETMAEIRTGAMVPPLIAVLTGVPDEVAEAARRALLVIARQDFGRDARKWNEWWARNGQRHRIEWLIDALMHEQPAVRRAAGDELKQLTKEYFGYYDDLPRKERERAHALYRAWWEKEGRRRFA